MIYLGHSTIYYQGSIGYKLLESDDGSFYSVYFDLDAFPVTRILCGSKNAISGTMFTLHCDDLPKSFNPDLLIDLLVKDLKQHFNIEVSVIL